jgi:hypothetical protein
MATSGPESMGPGVETAHAFIVAATDPPWYITLLVVLTSADADSQKIPRTFPRSQASLWV